MRHGQNCGAGKCRSGICGRCSQDLNVKRIRRVCNGTTLMFTHVCNSCKLLATARACERSGSGRNFRSPLTPLSVTPAHRSAHRSAPLRSAPAPLIRFSGPLRFIFRSRSRSAHMLWPQHLVVHRHLWRGRQQQFGR